MKHTAQIALTVLLLTIAAACHKDNKEAQLKALDEAYKSGVFSKEEYDAKKQALIGVPAAAPAPAAIAPAAPAPVGAYEPAPANPPAAAPPVAAAPPEAAPAPVTVRPPAAAPQYTPPPAAAPQAAPPSYTPPVSARPTPLRQAPPPPQAVPQTVPQAVPQTVPQAVPQSVPQAAPAYPQASPQMPAEPAEPEPAPLAGCQDAESRAGGSNAVQERFFPASEDVVRQAATRAFTNLDFTIHSSTGHEMEASKKKHLSAVVGAGGERVILHFSGARQGGQTGTRVTAETKKSIVGRLSQKSWTTAVMAQIGCNLRGGR